jgi:hypothetical protein
LNWDTRKSKGFSVHKIPREFCCIPEETISNIKKIRKKRQRPDLNWDIPEETGLLDLEYSRPAQYQIVPRWHERE